MIPYEDLGVVNRIFEEELKASFEKVLKKGWFVLGEQVSEFEKEFAAYIGCAQGVGVASGLDALLLSLREREIARGMEVIVPANTYIATILSIAQLGLIPVLVEPDIKTYNIDPNRIEEAITSKTCAIMPVHLYGKICAMDKIMAIAKKHQLIVIEDCAQAHGAKLNGQMAGSFGDFGAFSFYPTKTLGALGDAGLITCQSESVASRLKMFRNYGSRIKYVNEVVGWNSRLDEVQAAFLRVKLKKLDEINKHKQMLARMYDEALDRNKYILPICQDGYEDVFHIYNIRCKNRDRLKDYCRQNGVGTEVHYPIAPHQQEAMKGILNNKGHYPISEEIHRTTLSLPISIAHSRQDIEKVIEVLNTY